MATVPLDFVPPPEPDIVSLKIYESSTQDGDFALIETVDAGEYPNYISRYTTTMALSVDDWFAISWVDSKGAETPLSQAVQGNTSTLVNRIISRAMLRDPSLSENVLSQAAEYAISVGLKTDDPYDVTLTANYKQVEGLTLLALAEAQLYSAVSGGSGESYTAGLVSQKSGASGSVAQKDIEWLIKQANRLLGINVSLVMLLADIDPVGMDGVSSINWDHSRLSTTINYE